MKGISKKFGRSGGPAMTLQNHAVWIAFNCLWVLAAATLYARTHRTHVLFGALTLLIPLAYYASYLLATSCHNYRIMYPSTVFVQAVSIVSIGGCVGLGLQRCRAVFQTAVGLS